MLSEAPIEWPLPGTAEGLYHHIHPGTLGRTRDMTIPSRGCLGCWLVLTSVWLVGHYGWRRHAITEGGICGASLEGCEEAFVDCAHCVVCAFSRLRSLGFQLDGEIMAPVSWYAHSGHIPSSWRRQITPIHQVNPR